MRLVPHLVLISIYVTLTYSSLYSNVKDNVIQFIQRSLSLPDEIENKIDFEIEKKKDSSDAETAQSKSWFLKKIRKKDKSSETDERKRKEEPKLRYIKDPVLNSLGRRHLHNKKISLTVSESSSLELTEWKDDWKEHWVLKKFEAINSTAPRGDVVNMLGASKLIVV
jgi:hypothetical protein